VTHPSHRADSPIGTTPGPPTQEIPAVLPPPSSSGPVLPPGTPPDQPADPAAFVPGFAGPQPAAYPPPAEPPSGRRWSPRRRAAALGVGLVLLSLLLLAWGLSVGRDPLWETATLWSVFGFACALAVLLVFVPDAPRAGRSQPGPARRIALGALAGLGVFWLVAALPQAASNRGFLLTAAFAAAVAAVWTNRDRSAPVGR
jgi:hypothetical protein